MKQVLQNLRSGEIELADIPSPRPAPGHLVIQTRASLISAGTERMIVEFSKASLLSKARQNPERVRQVLDKIKADGLMPTLETVFSRLDEPMPLGYCNAGTVIDVGEGVTAYKVGDRVASNGHHAEIVSVPVNLCAKIPASVSDEEAAFTVLSSIALQGIRLAAPTLGENIVVFGLGLVGLITVQLLRANGCRVLGIDFNRRRCEMAKAFGAETLNPAEGSDAIAGSVAFSGGAGIDAVIVTASTKSSDLMHQAAQMSRKRGRIVLVGVVGLELNRADFYEKELTFQVSCSYGPGRYDPAYEQKGQDYPLGFVRWTEQRNMSAVLEMMASGRLDVKPMITSRLSHASAIEAYRQLTDDASAIGIIMEYPADPVAPLRSVEVAPSKAPIAPQGQVVIGLIGAGMFTKGVLGPAMASTGATLKTVASSGGVTGTHVARKLGFATSTTDYRTILDDASINTVVITTRHDTHPKLIVESLEAGKHVFVEKPVAIDHEGFASVRSALAAAQDRHFMVGFNRRFSPLAEKMKRLLDSRTAPMCMNFLVNAGRIPMDHWAQDPAVGGGRILGEACHWIDLLAFLAGAPVTDVFAVTVGESPALDTTTDKMTITLRFGDGSIGTVHYFANGHKSFAKESLQVFSDGRILELDNFRILRGYGFGGFRKMKLMRQDKGHRKEMQRFVDALQRGGDPPMTREEIFNVTEATFAAVESAESGKRIVL